MFSGRFKGRDLVLACRDSHVTSVTANERLQQSPQRGENGYECECQQFVRANTVPVAQDIKSSLLVVPIVKSSSNRNQCR